MREEDETFEDLSRLFTAEDRALEAKPFVDGVMGRIRRKQMMRRMVLLGVGAAGAVIAALQVPSLLGEWVPVDNTLDTSLVSALSSAQQQAGLFASSNPLWLSIAAVVGLSLALVATMERA